MPSLLNENRLRVLRQRRKLTQAEVASLTSQALSTVNKHENGIRGLTALDIKRYAKVYRVETYEIFFDPEQLNFVQDGQEDQAKETTSSHYRPNMIRTPKEPPELVAAV